MCTMPLERKQQSLRLGDPKSLFGKNGKEFKFKSSHEYDVVYARLEASLDYKDHWQGVYFGLLTWLYPMLALVLASLNIHLAQK